MATRIRERNPLAATRTGHSLPPPPVDRTPQQLLIQSIGSANTLNSPVRVTFPRALPHPPMSTMCAKCALKRNEVSESFDSFALQRPAQHGVCEVGQRAQEDSRELRPLRRPAWPVLQAHQQHAQMATASSTPASVSITSHCFETRAFFSLAIAHYCEVYRGATCTESYETGTAVLTCT